MKKNLLLVAVAAVLLIVPSLVSAAGVPGATVLVMNRDTGAEFGTTLTDAAGAFNFDGVPAGAWLLGVATPDGGRQAWLGFDIAAEKAPARFAGQVATQDGADVSLQVDASVVVDGVNDVDTIVLDPGYPLFPRAWNRNWLRANGKLHVVLAGTGLEGLAKVVLTSATGSIESTLIVLDPVDGEYHAIFPKKAAFAALVPAGAPRGEVVAITIDLTTATGTGTFDSAFRVVGPRKICRR